MKAYSIGKISKVNGVTIERDRDWVMKNTVNCKEEEMSMDDDANQEGTTKAYQ